MWRKFFGDQARIIGIELNPVAKRFEKDGFEIHIGNQSDENFWKDFFQKVGEVDIVLDDGHSVDVHQRYGSHTANIDLTNAGGAYNLDLTQNANTNQTYNMTGTCTNALGCGVSVVQN